MSDTAIGQRPPQGGHIKRYDSNAERARAWRAAQRQRREAGEAASAVAPALAPASLAATLDSLRQVVLAHQSTSADLAGRVEAAIEAVADPQAIDEHLAEAQARAAREVAEVHDELAKARRARTDAEAQARAAQEEAERANEAGSVAWDRAEVLEVDLRERDQALERLTTEHASTLTAHAAQLAELKDSCETRLAAQLQESTVARQAELSSQRAELVQAQQAELAVLRASLSGAESEAARARGAEVAALEQVHTQRAELERSAAAADAALADANARREDALAGLRARLEGELDGQRARVVALEEVVETRQVEIAHLAALLAEHTKSGPANPKQAISRRTPNSARPSRTKEAQ